MARTRYYWLVVGIYTDYENLSYIQTSNEHCLFTSKEKAQAEFGKIIEEARQEANENGYEFDYNMGEDSLCITYETGSTEDYYIRKVRLN